jgi:hypothetical protein
MDDHKAGAIDRLMAGELSAAEQRQLAQAALDDEELFDRLSAAGVARTALRGEANRVRRRPWVRFAVGGVTAAAAAVLFLAVRSYSRPAGSETQVSKAPAAAADPSVPPVATPTAILLTARVDTATTSTFRTGGEASRMPKRNGTVVTVTDGTVDLDLGSLDGLTQGLELPVTSTASGSAGAGRVRITAVFRERSRAQRVAGDVHPGDRVVSAPGTYATALLSQVRARQTARDWTGANALVALVVAEPQAPPDLRREALERRAEIFNELAAIDIGQGRYAEAERTLDAAQGDASETVKIRVANNRGVLAARRGDRTAAGTFYRQAASLAGASPGHGDEQATIAKNLLSLDARSSPGP